MNAFFLQILNRLYLVDINNQLTYNSGLSFAIRRCGMQEGTGGEKLPCMLLETDIAC